MQTRTLTNRQARRFLLLRHGLLGSHRFIGADGALQYVRQCGSIQFDPVDLCGKNAELVLLARVKNFKKEMLDDLLYLRRALFDYPDKCLCILPVEDWPYFERFRAAARRRGEAPQIGRLCREALDYIAQNGPVDSDTLPLSGDVRWKSAIHWSNSTKASRAALEQLYSAGELVIHHRSGSRKSYDLAQNHLPSALLNAPDPLPDDADHLSWRVLRRIGAVGLLANAASDAWLNIDGLKAAQRSACFEQLLAEERIVSVKVDGFPRPLYCRREDLPLLDEAASERSFTPRCELLAPLDCFLWDRKLIRALFRFDYTWEVYVPPQKRRFGAYVLPILWGERLVGRIEPVADRKNFVLQIKNVWFEPDFKPSAAFYKALQASVLRLAHFNDCKTVDGMPSDL